MILQQHFAPMIENALGAAARRKCQSILDEMLWPSTESALREIPIQSGMQIVDISCGAGGITLPLMEMLGPKGQVISFDCDKANIELVSGKINNQLPKMTSFVNCCFENWDGTASADLIIGRCILNDIDRNRAIVSKAATLLADAGVLVLEFLDFSKSQSFPRSYALDRYCEYMRTYQHVLQQPPQLPEFTSLCEGTELQQPSISALIPRFLDSRHKQLPSLMLEYLTPFIVENDLNSQIELQAIISELRELANQPAVMITAPVGVRLATCRSCLRQSIN